jgi:Copine
VQFVQFKDFKNSADISMLAEEVLREVPDQFCGYMVSKKIKPQIVPLMSQNTLNKQFIQE